MVFYLYGWDYGDLDSIPLLWSGVWRGEAERGGQEEVDWEWNEVIYLSQPWMEERAVHSLPRPGYPGVWGWWSSGYHLPVPGGKLSSVLCATMCCVGLYTG